MVGRDSVSLRGDVNSDGDDQVDKEAGRSTAGSVGKATCRRVVVVGVASWGGTAARPGLGSFTGQTVQVDNCVEGLSFGRPDPRRIERQAIWRGGEAFLDDTARGQEGEGERKRPGEVRVVRMRARVREGSRERGSQV